MAAKVGHVIGREPELDAIGRFLDDPLDGLAALLIEGEAGIGKTTLWQAGVDAAMERGYRVLTARIGVAET
jgi:tRNA A37 threonylcarbamoyladenosine biosynthesis protein TsaE